MCSARRNHRETVFRLIDPDIGDHRPVDLDHFLDHVIDLVGPLGPQPHPLACFRELNQVRQRIGITFRVAAAVQQFLPLTDHAHILVVGNEDLHRRSVLNRGRHFLHIHQE